MKLTASRVHLAQVFLPPSAGVFLLADRFLKHQVLVFIPLRNDEYYHYRHLIVLLSVVFMSFYAFMSGVTQQSGVLLIDPP